MSMQSKLIRNPADFQVQMHRCFEQVSNLASKESSEQFQCVLDLRERFNGYFQSVNMQHAFKEPPPVSELPQQPPPQQIVSNLQPELLAA